jgi:soluble lytic murein transglycosylase-like protein
MWLRVIIFLISFIILNPLDEGYTKEYSISEIKGSIMKWCIIYDLDYNLMLSISNYESSFDPKMTNPKSTSSGLFGMLKGTYNFVGKMNDYDNIPHGNIPIEMQIELGCRYMRYLLDKYNGNVKKSLNEWCNEKTYYERVMKLKNMYQKGDLKHN